MSEWTTETLKELMYSELAARDRALELQGVEMSRRLENLNNEAERLNKQAETYVRQDVYESNRQALIADARRHEDRSQPWQLWFVGTVVVVVTILSQHL